MRLLERMDLVDEVRRHEILYERTRDDAEYRFGDSVTALTQTADGVDVEFEHGAARRFDLVVGADGMHSAVRALAFRAGGRVRHVPRLLRRRFHHAQRARPRPFRQLDHAQVVDLVADRFAGAAWEVPRLIGGLRSAMDLHFAPLQQIHMESWSRGRVVLPSSSAIFQATGGAPRPRAGASASRRCGSARPREQLVLRGKPDVLARQIDGGAASSTNRVIPAS